MSLTVFTQRNFVADFLQAMCDFILKSAVCVFDLDLGATYNDHLRLILKLDFLLVLIELLSISVTAKALRAIIASKIGDFVLTGVG